MPPSDPSAFIRANLMPREVAGLGGLRLYAAHPGSGLSRLGAAPYWAYAWAGGLALAHHLIAHPGLVRDRRVLDLGAGSGLVGLVAARAGAWVTASESSSFGAAAIDLNAALNGVTIAVTGDVTEGSFPDVDLVLAGDVFYDTATAARIMPFLERCAGAGITVLIGDPGRADLPVSRLRRVAVYPVTDAGGTAAEGMVFVLEADGV